LGLTEDNPDSAIWTISYQINGQGTLRDYPEEWTGCQPLQDVRLSDEMLRESEIPELRSITADTFMKSLKQIEKSLKQIEKFEAK